MTIEPLSITALAAQAESNPARTRSVLLDPDYWRRLAESAAGTNIPTILGAGPRTPPPRIHAPDAARRDRLRAHLDDEGYARAPGFLDPKTCHSLAAASLRLVDRGWPATFLLMFDAPWRIGRHLGQLMRSLVNDEVVLRYEMFVYCIDSTRAMARARGIEPHRDAPQAGFDQRAGRRMPRHCTSWLALTDTDAHNGCIHLVPTSRDHDGRDEIDQTAGVPLPVSAGTALTWGGHVAHWGGVHDPARASGPRVALTCVASVEPIWGLPPLDLPTEVDATELPSLAQRLDFIRALLRGFGPAPRGSAAATVLDALGPEPSLHRARPGLRPRTYESARVAP